MEKIIIPQKLIRSSRKKHLLAWKVPSLKRIQRGFKPLKNSNGWKVMKPFLFGAQNAYFQGLWLLGFGNATYCSNTIKSYGRHYFFGPTDVHAHAHTDVLHGTFQTQLIVNSEELSLLEGTFAVLHVCIDPGSPKTKWSFHGWSTYAPLTYPPQK